MSLGLIIFSLTTSQSCIYQQSRRRTRKKGRVGEDREWRGAAVAGTLCAVQRFHRQVEQTDTTHLCLILKPAPMSVCVFVRMQVSVCILRLHIAV